MNHPREYVAFIHTDDDELPGGRFPPYRDEWLTTDWTLGQCVGWIHGRTPAWGRRFAPEYLRRKAPSPLAPVSQADAREYLRRAASEDRQLDLQHRLWCELFAKLAAGEITAHGKKSVQEIEGDIPQGLWREDTVDHNDMHGGTHDDVGTIDGVTVVGGERAYSRVAYHAVRVRRADVLRVWPAPVVEEQEVDPSPSVALAEWPTVDRSVGEPDRSDIPGDKPEELEPELVSTPAEPTTPQPIKTKSYPDDVLDARLKQMGLPDGRAPTQVQGFEYLRAYFEGVTRDAARKSRDRVFPGNTTPGPKGPRSRKAP